MIRDRKRKPEQLDRLPPHSPEAEQGVLGCILLDPVRCVDECIEKFLDDPEVFYDLRHQTIFQAMSAMRERNENIDLITLQQCLKNAQALEEVGGLMYLSTLPDTVPSAANLSYYIEIVLEKFTLRRLVHVCTRIVGEVYESQGETELLLDAAEKMILSVRRLKQGSRQSSMQSLIPLAISEFEKSIAREGRLAGYGTGLVDYDKMTGGLMDGEVTVFAARPSMGKTSLATQIAEHVALEYGIPVGIFSLEMTDISLVKRMVSSKARVNLRNIAEGFLAERDYPKLVNACGALHKAKIHFDDESGTSIGVLRAKARRFYQMQGVRMFVIDYLQLLTGGVGNKRPENRQQEVSEISAGIKSLAKELKVPVIVLSQLNRIIDREKTRKPVLADLRESGAIEQDADVVGLLFKPQLEEGDYGDDTTAVPMTLMIAKQRNGPTGDVHLTFLKSYTRFESAAKVSDDDVPTDITPNLPYRE